MSASQDPPRKSDAPDISVEPLRYHAGDRIGAKYQLVELMGKGGMGSVWRAQNLALGVDVAVKLVHGELASPETTERLSREAQAAARLEHPSAVRVFDLGETELGDPFIVMELLRGESLRELLERRSKIPAIELVPLLLPVASALVAAHGKGIVHRDLKPENLVLVEHEGHLVPKVVDFGLAKVESSAFDRRSTREGTIMGSPDYMAPEQARGDVNHMDARTDVWSLGVVLYEALAGHTPFTAGHPLALLRAIIEDEPTTLEALGAADSELSAIVGKALAKSPNQRWADMRSFGRALADWAIAHGIDTDATGASIAAHWTRGSRGSLTSSEAQVLLAAPSPVDSSSSASTGLSSIEEAHGTESRPAVWQAPGRSRSYRFIPIALGIAVVSGGVLVFLSRSSRGPTTITNTESSVTDVQKQLSSVSDSSAALPPATAGAPTASAASIALAPSAQASASAVSASPASEASSMSNSAVLACVSKLFPDDAFEVDAPLAKLCNETDPRKGAAFIRTEIARHGFLAKRTTESMRLWALLSWYELPTFALTRGACCPIDRLAPVDLPPSVGTCPPLGPLLDEIEHSAHGRVSDPMMKDFRTAALCIDRGQRINAAMESPFPYDGPPGGGAESAFRRILEKAH